MSSVPCRMCTGTLGGAKSDSTSRSMPARNAGRTWYENTRIRPMPAMPASI